MPVETIRISQVARDQLIRLKRHTGISNWNVLCRWSYCLSLKEPTPPRRQKLAADSPVEMTWRTFGGELDDVYRGLALDRAFHENLADEVSEGELFRLHLHRGVGYLAGDRRVRDIAGLLRLAVSQDGTSIAHGEPEPATNDDD